MIMRHLLPLAAILALMLAGCETTKKEAAPPPVQELSFNYPKAIYVYDFAVAAAEVSYLSVAAPRLSGATDDPDKTEQRDALERQIADAVVTQVVAKLTELGLPAVRWRGTVPLNEDAYIVEGQFLTVGSNGVPDHKIVGLALGGGELRVLAQAYRVDGKQRRLLGEADVGKESPAPGLATELPVAKLSAARAAQSVATGAGVVRSLTNKVKKGAEDTAAAIVEQLKPKMQEQGWF
jgi:hypothetical protein